MSEIQFGMRYNLHLLILLICSIVLPGCNDDIFITPEPVIDDMELDGNGGKAKFEIRKKDLHGIDIECPYFGDYYSNVQFYGKDGEELRGQIDVYEVSKVSFTTPFCAVDFLVEGNEVTVVALDNALSHNVGLTVWLNYGVTVSSFQIIITPGLPLKVDNMGYGIEPMKVSTDKQAGVRTTMSNNSSVTQHLNIVPFENAEATVKYESSDNWETGATGYVPVLYYSNGEWLWPYEPNANIEIGAQTQYTPYGIDLNQVVSVDVPPFSKVTVDVNVVYATCLTSFSCDVIMPNSGDYNIIWGTCQIRQPIDYEITAVCEEL